MTRPDQQTIQNWLLLAQSGNHDTLNQAVEQFKEENKVKVSALHAAIANLAKHLETFNQDREWAFVDEGQTLEIAESLLLEADCGEGASHFNVYIALGGGIDTYSPEAESTGLAAAIKVLFP